MHVRSMRARFSVIATVVALLAVFAAPAGADPTVQPVADGFIGPLGLAIGDDGTIYVGEAFGGRLSAISKHGEVTAVVEEPGTEIAGVDAKGKGTLVFTQTIYGEGEPGEEAPPLDASLKRYQPSRTGTARTIASTQAFEERYNPDSENTYGLVDPSEACLAQWPEFVPPSYDGIVESHPYAVAIVPGGYAIADAAANALLYAQPNGRMRTLAVLPAVPQVMTADVIAGVLADFGIDISDCEGETYLGEPVPTDVEIGPDGHYYVSTLPGFPEAPGYGAIWQVSKYTGKVTQIAGGLVSPVDIAIARDGTIYVAQLFSGQIAKIVNGSAQPVVDLPLPGALEIDRNGALYAAICALCETGGSVVKITP